MAFSLYFFDLAPGLRVAGDSLAYAYKFTKKGGQADGTEGLEVGLTDDPTIKLLEAAVSGFEQVTDRDAVYTTLAEGGLTELVPGLAIGIDALSSIETSATEVRLSLAGAQPVLVFRNANVPAVTKVGDGGYTWDLPTSLFTGFKTTAESYQSDLRTKVDEMISNRIAADDVLTAAISAQASSDETARAAIQADVDQNEADADAAIAAEEARVDALIASGMWLFADQAAFPAAADNHGRVVHSHADGAMFYAHGGMWHQLSKEVDLQTAIASIDNEALAREAADTTLQGNIDAEAATRAADDTTEANTRAGADAALSGRLDVLEADPTTAAAVAAGDTATLSSANSYTDTAVSNVIGTAPGVLDTLGEIADAINDDANVYTTLVSQIAAVQSDVDGNETDSDAAEAALSGRLDTLEADPTTATAVAAADAALSSRLDVLEADPTTQSALDAEVVARNSADSALDGRVTTLEGNAAITDPTTATAVAAVQSDVDANQTASESADSALSGRLDVLEADPTTATAVAAVQADVDQNESDGDAADAALSGRLDVLEADPTTATAVALKAPLADPDFTGQLEVDTNARLEFDSNNLTKISNVLRGTDIEIGNNITLNPAAADGRVEIEGGLYLRPSDMVDAANDVAAAAAGVIVGQLYRNGSDLKIRVS